MRNIDKRTAEQGFTLVELMVVVTIIGIIASIGLPRLQQFLRTAQTSEATQQFGRISENITGFISSRTEDDAAIAVFLNNRILDIPSANVAAAQNLSSIIPQLALPDNARFRYSIKNAAVTTDGNGITRINYCIVAQPQDATIAARLVYFSTTTSADPQWNGNINISTYLDPAVQNVLNGPCQAGQAF